MRKIVVSTLALSVLVAGGLIGAAAAQTTGIGAGMQAGVGAPTGGLDSNPYASAPRHHHMKTSATGVHKTSAMGVHKKSHVRKASMRSGSMKSGMAPAPGILARGAPFKVNPASTTIAPNGQNSGGPKANPGAPKT